MKNPYLELNFLSLRELRHQLLHPLLLPKQTERLIEPLTELKKWIGFSSHHLPPIIGLPYPGCGRY